jgi:hypothetical protein
LGPLCPMCSQPVLYNVPNSTSFFCPILFGSGSTSKYITFKRGVCFYFGGKEAYLGFYVGECPMFHKYWWWANQMATSEQFLLKK